MRDMLHDAPIVILLVATTFNTIAIFLLGLRIDRLRDRMRQP